MHQFFQEIPWILFKGRLNTVFGAKEFELCSFFPNDVADGCFWYLQRLKSMTTRKILFRWKLYWLLMPMTLISPDGGLHYRVGGFGRFDSRLGG
jgi:hypothetical protein